MTPCDIVSFWILYFIRPLIHLCRLSHKDSNFSNWNFLLWWQMLWYIPPSPNKSPGRCSQQNSMFSFHPFKKMEEIFGAFILRWEGGGVFIMDLSDKLVTTSGEKESHDFPFSPPASLQCGQILQFHGFFYKHITFSKSSECRCISAEWSL